jgi:hypothetical protein
MFHICSSLSYQSRFLTIDTIVLYNMIKNGTLIDGNKKYFMELRDEHFDIVFKLKGLCLGKFSHLVEMDGVSACFHLHIPKRG